MRKLVILTLFFIILYPCCRYSAPLIKFNKEVLPYNENEPTDIKKANYVGYMYFRVSTYGIFGGYIIYRDFNEKGELIKLVTEKQKVWGLFDGTQRTKMKTIYYENSRISRIDYKIIQAFGIGGRIIVDKSIIFDENGTKKRINHKKCKD